MKTFKNIQLDTSSFQVIKTIDMHTGGEPLRVILEGLPLLTEKSVLENRRKMLEDYDDYRIALMFEPRGHTDMYGLIPVSAEREDSEFGVLFLHNEGYSTMCGHATIAISKLAVEMGWVKQTGQETTLKLDAPCGQLTVYVHANQKHQVTSVSFDNVPSFVVALDEEIHVPGLGKVKYDLAYGGAFYAYVDVDQFDFDLSEENYSLLKEKGMDIKRAIMNGKSNVIHPFEEELSFLYGTIFIEASNKKDIHSKNVCVFAEGEVDRSSTGSGVAGRAAIHFARKELALHKTIEIESIIGSTMSVTPIKEIQYGPYQAIIPRVNGTAYITGQHEFLIDQNDVLKNGFILR